MHFINDRAILSKMSLVSDILPYIQIGLSVLLVVAIILQQSAAGMGGAFGDNFSSGYHTRRGFEKTLFYSTIIIGVLFALSAFVALVLKA